MTRTRRKPGGVHRNSMISGLWIALTVLLFLTMIGGSADAQSPPPGAASHDPEAVATSEGRLTTFRSLSADEQPVELIELGRLVLDDLEGTDQTDVEAESERA